MRLFKGRTPELSTWAILDPDHMLNDRPAVPFGNRKKYLRGSFQFSIVTIQKNITPLET